MFSTQKFSRAALVGAAGVALWGAWAPAMAQQQAADVEEVVVTGTMIRGISPPGSNVIGMSQEQIQGLAANNTQDILSSMPQATNFNNLAISLPAGGIITSNQRVPVARPNIRNLPCAGGASGACTLILIDGHRVVPEGIQQIAVDPAAVPAGIIDHIETIVDGNSAIYGSDAVGGVINFITKKNFDGTMADAHYGFAKGYSQIDANITSGVSWDKGSLVATYSFGKHDALYARDRDYVQGVIWTTTPSPFPTGQTIGSPAGTACNLPNVAVAGTTYGAPALTPGGNYCDTARQGELYPSEVRHNGFITMKQDITDTVKFDLSAFYSSNKQVASNGTLNTSNPGVTAISVTTRNPYYQQIPGTAANATQSVQLSYAPLFGENSAINGTNIEAGQITPTVTVDIGDWQVRTLASWGKSNTSYDNVVINANMQTLLFSGPSGSTAAIPQSAALNPYNLLATTNTALFSALTYHDRGNGVNEFLNVRSIADGKLFALPGGDVHAAIGAEFYKDQFKTRITDSTTTLLQPYSGVSQKAYAGFGEINVPVVGNSNSMPGIQRLTISASGRYDKYDGVSGRFDPKVGLTYDPIDWITLRGNWGKSFNAPNPADRAGALPQVQLIRLIPLSAAQAGVFTPSGTTLPVGQPSGLLILTGTSNNLKPQSSTNWSLGTDVRPPMVENLTVSATYYHIDFQDILGLPTVAGNQAPLFNNYPNLYQFNQAGIDPATLAAFAANAPLSGPAALAQAAASNTRIIEYIDGRTTNLGSDILSGIDFNVSYNMKTGFGSVDARFSGNYQLKRESRYAPNSPPVDDLFVTGFAPMNFSLVVGANLDKLRVQGTWNHTSGYDIFPQTGVLATQTSFDSFDAFNLFFRYDIDGSGLAKDTSVTFNIDNLTDAAPPIYKSNGGNGTAPNIRTLGRLISFGVSKKF